MSIIINLSENEYKQLLPVQTQLTPITLSSSWVDLSPGHLINVNGASSMGLWFDLSPGTVFNFRIMATFAKESSDFFQLPIQYVTATNIAVTVQEFELDTTTMYNKVIISIPLASVINFCKVQVKGSGSVDRAFITRREGP